MFEHAQATSIIDLMTKLSTFAVANGWTEDFSDYVTNRRLFLHRSTLFVSFNWDPATPANVGIYQATAFSGSGTAPGNHAGDSGQGVISNSNATIATGRYVKLDNDTNNYWFFESDTYLHVVVEVSTGVFQHFGTGILTKFGNNWTGGEYCYGERHSGLAGSTASPLDVNASVLLDAITQNASLAFMASLKMSGIPGQAAGTWGVVGVPTAPGNDRGGSARSKVYGGYRGNTIGRAWGQISSDNAQGLVPLYEINCFAFISTSTLYFMGTMPDVRGVHMLNFAGGDEIIIGGETWVLFPSLLKGAIGGTGTTRGQGIAYRKVTT